MEHDGFGWIYLLFFLIIPLSRILPRLLKKAGLKNFDRPQTLVEDRIEQESSDTIRDTRDTIQEHTRDSTIPEPTSEPSVPETNDMLVLRELQRGVKKFENVKKNLGLDTNELNSILKDLEKRNLMRVEQKSGLTGPKVELHITDKGFQEYFA